MEREKVPIIKHMLWLLPATWSQLRTLGMVFMHSFRKRETVNYPEQQVYLPPRYRGRIVLTRDPDGEERCVACNLCAVACPVDCISLQKGEPPSYKPLKDRGIWLRTPSSRVRTLNFSCPF